VTVVEDVYPENNNVASVINTDTISEEVIYAPSEEEKPAMDRAGHLAKLRSKIAEFKETITGPTPVPEPIEIPPSENNVEETVVTLTAELKCPLYQSYIKPWSPQGLNFSVVEGARLLYREVEVVNSGTTTSSSTLPVELTKEVLLQLPLQTYGAANKSCLPSDVVGIALDGSLIKNNEYAMYSIFGPETLVGYALDGFPIYGQSDVETDECGGIFVDGQYRYHLSKERTAVLYCYSGTPVEI
jgi:hypothetical protein